MTKGHSAKAKVRDLLRLLKKKRVSNVSCFDYLLQTPLSAEARQSIEANIVKLAAEPPKVLSKRQRKAKDPIHAQECIQLYRRKLVDLLRSDSGARETPPYQELEAELNQLLATLPGTGPQKPRSKHQKPILASTSKQKPKAAVGMDDNRKQPSDNLSDFFEIVDS